MHEFNQSGRKNYIDVEAEMENYELILEPIEDSVLLPQQAASGTTEDFLRHGVGEESYYVQLV